MSSPECVDPNHFQVINGALVPQPWMQYRRVASESVPTVAGSYPVSTQASTTTALNINTLSSVAGGAGEEITSILGTLGLTNILGGLFGGIGNLSGGVAAPNHNDLLQTVIATWTNDSPIDQWVYGLITRGGARVTLQARSRGYLATASGFAEGDTSAVTTLTVCSKLGTGADMGAGGTLATGTSYCISEARQNSLTIPLAPEIVGMHKLAPGVQLTGIVQVRFVSEFWENSAINGGDTDTESSYETGETQLDLYAIPVI